MPELPTLLMHRLFLPPAQLLADAIPLSGEQLRYLTVLRLHAGDEIELLDGTGTLCHCRLGTFSRTAVTATVLSRHRESETGLALRLLQGLPKGDKLELILQKGVELGITAFTPVVTARSVPRGAKGERWEKIIQEAARQSRRPCLPRLDPVQPLSQALQTSTETLRLLLWEGASQPLATALPRTAPSACALLIGPEGGFSAEEAAQAVAHGFVPVSLGRRILRTETAGFAIAAILQHRYGDLGRV